MDTDEKVNTGRAGNEDIGGMILDAVQDAVRKHGDSASGVVLHLVLERRGEGVTTMHGPTLVWGDVTFAEHAKLFGRALAIAEQRIMPGADAATVQ
ncbi:MAG TPA: hypothetical protein VE028_01520 [Nitratidesulfovibrio sp.]|nr:hypothetical protein [Nitratidesulfovibrio sp.]